MHMLCIRCYINKNKLTKKQAKHLNVTDTKFTCSGCEQFKKIVIEKRTWEEDNYDEDE